MRARAKERDVLGKNETAMRNNNSGVHYPKKCKNITASLSVYYVINHARRGFNFQQKLSFCLSRSSLPWQGKGRGRRERAWVEKLSTN